MGVDNATALVSEIEVLQGIERVTVVDDQRIIESNHLQQAMGRVLNLCQDKRVPVRTLELLAPNLENVFLHLTGRRLRD